MKPVMATHAQVQANRKNSRLSTGPRTAKGKAASSRNAVSHGLNSVDPVLLHEDRARFAALIAEYEEEFAPVGVHEQFLVRQMADCRWRLDRAHRIENAIYDQTLLEGVEPDSPEQRMAAALLAKPGDALGRIQRYISAIERSYYKALSELRAYRRFRNKADACDLAERKLMQLVTGYADDQYRRAMAGMVIPEEPCPEPAAPTDSDPSPLELPPKAA